ncbi:MAG: serine hydrolase [Bacteroidales bacterium]
MPSTKLIFIIRYVKNLTFILPLLTLLTSCNGQTNYSQQTQERIKEIENNITGNLILNDERPGTISERMAKYNVKGVSIAVIRDYKIVWAKGYGWADDAEKKPVTTETLFEPGSISKALNALGILKLAQEKKLDLYTDINTYLTSWKFPYDSLSNGKKITLADILSHNAGLSVHGFPGHDMNDPIPSVIQVLDGKKPATTMAVRSMFEPGLGFQYSGGGITISQLLLTDITKQPYDKWMYENVLKPIGMTNSSFCQPPSKDMQSLCATGYLSDGRPISNKYHIYPELAAAGLWMTPSDLCNYIIDMQLAYQGKQHSKVLSPEMVKLHLSPYNNGPTSMGSFILDINGAKYFEHSAGNDGFCGDFYGSLDDGYGCVVFMNSEDPKLLSEIINSVAKAYHWKNFYKEPKRKNCISVPDSTLKPYEGIYLYDQAWAAIGKKNNGYHFYTNGVYSKMYFSTPTSFFNEEFPAVKEFIKDTKGNIIGYKRNVDGKEYPSSIKITNPDTLQLQSMVFHEISLYLFDIKKYNESILYLKRGTKLFPKDLELLMNLANMYLYNNEYDKAMAIYKAHLNDNVGNSYTWQSLLQFYVKYYRDRNYDVQVFEKVFKELNIKWEE